MTNHCDQILMTEVFFILWTFSTTALWLIARFAFFLVVFQKYGWPWGISDTIWSTSFWYNWEKIWPRYVTRLVSLFMGSLFGTGHLAIFQSWSLAKIGIFLDHRLDRWCTTNRHRNMNRNWTEWQKKCACGMDGTFLPKPMRKKITFQYVVTN